MSHSKLPTPNAYGQAILDLIRDEEHTLASMDPRTNILVQALAGSGKTTLILSAIETILAAPIKGAARKVLVLAFNKSIATEMQERIDMLFGDTGGRVSAMTLNSLGHRALMKAPQFCGRRLQLDAGKVKDIFWRILDNEGDSAGFAADDISTLDRIIGLAKAGRPEERYDWLALAEGVDEELQAGWAQLLDRVLLESNRMAEMDCIIDFNDQLFLPVKWNLTLSKSHDIFVDESQDLSPIQIELISRLRVQNSRVVAVGDAHQSIYAFRGADAYAIRQLQDRFSMKLMPLNVCYRCDKSIVKAAQAFVPEIEHRELADEGAVIYLNAEEFEVYDSASLIEYIQGNNFSRTRPIVLCRYNAPLFGAAFYCIKNRIPFTFNNSQFSTAVTGFMSRALKNAGKNPQRYKGTSEEIMEICKRFFTAESANLKARRRFSAIDALQERLDVVLFLGEAVETYEAIKENIKLLASQQSNIGPQFMTIHKSKGLEADYVFWIDVPSRRQESDEEEGFTQRQQERNLRYVATTRAKHGLYIHHPA